MLHPSLLIIYDRYRLGQLACMFQYRFGLDCKETFLEESRESEKNKHSIWRAPSLKRAYCLTYIRQTSYKSKTAIKHNVNTHEIETQLANLRKSTKNVFLLVPSPANFNCQSQLASLPQGALNRSFT